MLCRKMKSGLLAVAMAAFAGLCVTAPANTSAAPLMLAQNDITLMPGGLEQPETEEVPMPDVAPSPGSSIPSYPSAGAQGGAPVTGAARIALLLPLNSPSLGTAAAAVRDGFLASYEKEHDPNISLTVVESGDAPQQVVDAYRVAVQDHDIVVGPLSRSGAAAIAASGQVARPTIALTQADAVGAALPQLLTIGLSVEDEARQAAGWASIEYPGEQALVVSTTTAWQRRAARAFQAAWQAQGLGADSVELSASEGNLSPSALLQLIDRIRASNPGLVFAALDAVQARQLREALGQDIAIYGTSQLNPYSVAGWAAATRQPSMDGVRFIDLPWMVQPDAPAVARYATGTGRGGDLERLYALGIDAYRVARQVAQGRDSFELDGVTGRLRIRFGGGASRFARVESQAVFQDGAAAPLAGAR
ncbi:penicillin-binding protein activator [Noviherbaspirillum pedocola]|uniref:Penicillin-binding protein activator n=1 Tax=Noviherbaspirillum pedocola TaxID=2801341 RepID=A0A934SVK3_9BURK|nr:penicillin-binding protein activator [Noviherbaspirillum pedocola]MBK4736399.1 penicillin-binding protein activator [Noviherbaspirillum pedocola]